MMRVPVTVFRPGRALRGLAPLAVTLLLAGCGGVLDPQGPVGASEKTILLNSMGIMLAVVVPSILLTLGVAWWFRASNTRATYRPDWEYSGKIEMVVWSIPAMVVLLLAGLTWIGAHDLDPPKPLASKARPLLVEVVALDWKWLFIYPDQGIASVNRLVVPAGTPVSFRITSAGVMNSFFIPQLGSQIYAMAGMMTRLNLLADRPGSYWGQSSQFSGDGFSGMHFVVDAMPQAGFDAWVTGARASGPALDAAGYGALAKPSQAVAPETFRSVLPGLFDDVMMHQGPGADCLPPAGKAGGAPAARAS